MAEKQKKLETVTDNEVVNDMKRSTNEFINKLKKEKFVEVNGNTMFKAYLGDFYTYLFNGVPVTIRFNGTNQKFRKSIAADLTKRLNEIANSKTKKVKNELLNKG